MKIIFIPLLSDVLRWKLDDFLALLPFQLIGIQEFLFPPLQTREVLDSMTKVGEIQARLKQMEVALDAAELEKREADNEAVLAKEKAESSKSEIKRIELKLASVMEERDRLKNVIEAFRKQKSVESGHEVVSGAVLQELEASLAKKENCIKELESYLSEQKEVNIRQLNEIKFLNEKLNNEARRIKSLEREGDGLRSQIALMESKLGHGDYSSANTKVLRMVNTLGVENEAKQTIEALQKELQKTKEQLLAVQELKEQSAGAGAMVDSYISGKIMKLKEQIATLEKREERYKTVFADRISVFRRACCELFGYKIVMDDHQRPDGIAVTRFILQSIYALSDDEKLEFEYESGNTNIVTNKYTSQPEISQQIVHLWLVPTNRELKMPFFLTLRSVQTLSDPKVVDGIKIELFGATTITRKTILEGGANNAPLTVFETTSHYDYDHNGCTNFFPDFAASSECSSCKCQDCKVKQDGVINSINALTASVKEMISKRGVIPSKRISYPDTPLEIKAAKRRRKDTSKASSIIEKARLQCLYLCLAPMFSVQGP
ncbi:Mitotic spindle checkpoint protein MAD1 [Capsicum baccatum]|uniref:Mitotic spindle checkpoint protein MAD1 n=1 Tax=Capsicum baccatum TaxID=33114 RepID=A0A2G2W8F9_CAPBA|nr:Mitotic spindle checkpoint protein MAD1 [Capsicum baccatum]